MRKNLFGILLLLTLLFGGTATAKTTVAKTKVWKPTTPEGFTQIDWVKANGIASFFKSPPGNGYADYLTVIYLPYNQIKLVASTTPKLDWGIGRAPFGPAQPATATLPPTDTPQYEGALDIPETTTTAAIAATTTTTSTVPEVIHNWAFTRQMIEDVKSSNPKFKFLWNIPFFNQELLTTDLSLSLKSNDQSGTYITSGSRPQFDTDLPRKMLIINNMAGTSTVADFDEKTFINDGDQAVEGFAPNITPKGTSAQIARLFVGVRPGGKELVVYCSQGASPAEASEALVAAGVPIENQLQADGGTSATCAYNLPGQYFVEPGRTLPHLMGAIPVIRGTVTLKSLNVRQGPGTKYKITRELKLKDPIMVLESKNGWYRISDKNEWILAKYVKQI